MSQRDEIVKMLSDFLVLTSERELEKASKYLAQDAELIFPGGYRYRSLQEMAEGAKGRYRWVKKRFDKWDVFPDESSGVTTAYSVGTLYGEDLSGQAFEGIRFVDRFEIKDGFIQLQEVWNDMGQSEVGKNKE